MESNNKLINNKKFLLALAAAILIVLIIIIYSFSRNFSNSDEITDSKAADSDLEQEELLLESHPITDILPIINESPYYYIGPYFVINEDSLTFELEIVYDTEKGQAAALSRLQGQDLSKYNPSQYNIHYTKVVPGT